MDRLARSGTVIDAFLLNFAKDEICGVGVLINCPLETSKVKSGFLNQVTKVQFTAFDASTLQGFP